MIIKLIQWVSFIVIFLSSWMSLYNSRIGVVAEMAIYLVPISCLIWPIIKGTSKTANSLGIIISILAIIFGILLAAITADGGFSFNSDIRNVGFGYVLFLIAFLTLMSTFFIKLNIALWKLLIVVIILAGIALRFLSGY